MAPLPHRSSLPLMGIGNRLKPSWPPWPTASSLPLMGIGNPAAAVRTGGRPRSSLPLMGIGNPAAAVRTGGRPRSSLPLMGIGNRPRRAHRAAGTGHVAHYPSWGSETRTSGGGWRRPWLTLITPHGDRKPPLLLAIPPPRYCSLPLMGIGNWTSTTVGTRRITRSLPLMGIGNPTCSQPASESRRTHYPSWGSETRRRSAPAPALQSLITPHGDRKRPTPFSGTQPRRRLITPHGDRKLADAGLRDRRRTVAHYPSWGSETPAAAGCGRCG